jgi:hypothetical protein
VTSNALRDFVFITLGWTTQKQREVFHKEWHQTEERAACSDIANLSKHGIPEAGKTLKARQVAHGLRTVAEIWLAHYPAHEIRRRRVTDYTIVLRNGRKITTFELAEHVVRFWRDYFKRYGIKHRRQRDEDLRGLPHDNKPRRNFQYGAEQ